MSLSVAVMQPYFLPYIGYFQLIHAADLFVVYDNAKYTKKGWINRNRILVNRQPAYITLPLLKASDHSDIVDRQLAPNFMGDLQKLLRRVENAYAWSDYRDEGLEVLMKVLNCHHANLFDFLLHSIVTLTQVLRIQKPILRSSELAIDHNLKGQERVLAICKQLGASRYINPIGGAGLYSNDLFDKNGIELLIHEMSPFSYNQGSGAFVSHLSVIDSILCVGCLNTSRSVRDNYTLVRKTDAV